MICIECREDKRLDEFRWRCIARDERCPRCRPCDKMFRKIQREKSPEKSRERVRRFTQKRIELGVKPVSKICMDCHLEKFADQFAWSNEKAGFLKPRCKACDSEHRSILLQERMSIFLARNSRRRESRQAFINELKSDPCVDCDQVFDPCAMDFDHTNPINKVDKISRMVQQMVSIETLIAEIMKCDLVCAVCHRIRTKRRGRHERESRARRDNNSDSDRV